MFYLIHKKRGMTSFQVIRELRKKLGIKKMWHIGTLDPLASGLMLIATEQSTKLLPYLNNDKKGYIFTTELDGTTTSLDLEQPVESVNTENLSIPDKKILEQKLLETTEQIPPKFSAIHIDGKRAYKLARKDRDFEIPKREICIYKAKVLAIWETNITTELVISSGGYIRSFAPEIASWCGVDGGYISLLHRHELYFRNILLTEKDAVFLEDFKKDNFISEEMLFPEWKILRTRDEKSVEKMLLDIKNGIAPGFEDIKKVFQTEKIENEKILLVFDFSENTYSSLLENKNSQLKILRNDIISFL